LLNLIDSEGMFCCAFPGKEKNKNMFRMNAAKVNLFTGKLVFGKDKEEILFQRITPEEFIVVKRLD